MKNSFAALQSADPTRQLDLDALEATQIFDDLCIAIISEDVVSGIEDLDPIPEPMSADESLAPRGRSKQARLVTITTVVAVLLLVAALTITLTRGQQHSHASLPSGAHVTPWHAARRLPVEFRVARSQTSTSWQMVSPVVNAGWQLNTSGPPPSGLTCPSPASCYALAVRYASPNAGAKPQSVSLYVSSDLGSTWSVLPMPKGFVPTSRLTCANDLTCAVGGTQLGHTAFAMTIDGGHQWGVVQTSGTDVFSDVVCRSSAVCVGVRVPPVFPRASKPSTVVRTTDGGSSWTAVSLPASGTILTLSCPTDTVCVALGHAGPFRENVSGFVLHSNNGGQTWESGSLPPNFGFEMGPLGLSCADADHCMTIGETSIPNPAQCQGPHDVPPPGFGSCSSAATTLVSAIAVTSDGGATWTRRSLPTDVPFPQLVSISCASATVCWAAGQEAVPQVIGNVHDAGSPVVLGTSDGGLTWTKATFAVPETAPNYLGQSYLSIGQISCPSTTSCLALGVAAQSAPSTPVYRYQESDNS